MLLSNIPNIINCNKIYNLKKKDVFFNEISTNSKKINKRTIFVAVPINNFKKNYIQESLNNGALAIISDKYNRNISATQFIVNNINQSLITLLRYLKPHPPLNSIGVTGTNGKTSVVWFVSKICSLIQHPIKSYGTLGYFINAKKVEKSFLTTPEFEILYQRAFAKKKNNIFNFICEVSSHSLSQNRISNFPINIAAITNISHDHLDYHKTFHNYKKTKFKLFFNYLRENDIAVINDNIIGINLVKKKLLNRKCKIITYGTSKSDVNIISKYNKIEIKVYNSKYFAVLSDYKNFELENISCAICCCISLGIKINQIIKSLPNLPKPKGRSELVGKLNNGSKIYVDYAHTPDALKKILITNTIAKIKPNVLFGCGGERDKSKRSSMGFFADKYANKIYVTDDNPRNENPQKIRNDILSKCPRGMEIPNRKKAIQTAITDLDKKEILIIAGKGHENKQIIRNKSISFDDTKITKTFLNVNKV